MKPHIAFAHNLWQSLLQPYDIAIDATAGNGHDTLFLSKRCKSLFAIDIQETAIKKTELKLQEELSDCSIQLICQSHATFPKEIKPGSVRLIVYNLGYLPGGDKQITTMTSSTLLSLKNALPLLMPGGMITVTLYPGHPEGFRETEAILTFAKHLKDWKVEHKTWKENPTSPSVLLLTHLTQ